MYTFDAFKICANLRLSQSSASTYSALRRNGSGGIRLSAAEIADLDGHLDNLMEMAKKHGFNDYLLAIQMAKTVTTENPDASTMATEMDHVINELLKELRLHTFLLVEKDRQGHIDNNSLFGAKVTASFPSAAEDIKEAGNCMASECNTAAVFHLMRAVEWALRALASHLGIKKLQSFKKSSKVRLTPVSHSEWEQILNALQDAVDAKVSKLKRGAEKQRSQEFYYPALQDIRAIRDAWRNHVMHTRAFYDRNDAAAIFSHVQRLMQALSKRVTE